MLWVVVILIACALKEEMNKLKITAPSLYQRTSAAEEQLIQIILVLDLFHGVLWGEEEEERTEMPIGASTSSTE